MVDYSDMENLKHGVHPSGATKYVYGSSAYFAVPKRSIGGRRPLSVFAIKGGNKSNSQIFTPADNEWSWKIAKTMLNASHYTYHEIITHLGLTHLVIEPILISMRRQLDATHPINYLLAPHFLGTRSINHLAFERLIQPGESVDKLVGVDIKASWIYLKEKRMAFNFKESYLPTKLNKQGLTKQAGGDIPSYPYRDDGLEMWQAIKNWITSYVTHYYSSDSTVAADSELQAWAKEVSDMRVDQGGGLKGFGTNSSIKSRSELIDICTMIIFTAGPQHAAVNFTQKTDMSNIVATPLSGYQPEATTKNHSEKDFINFLPPIDVALVQASMLELLGGVCYTRIGIYEPDYFKDPKIKEFENKFKAELQALERRISERNNQANRKNNPYIALLPSRVPQSINI